MPVGSAANWSNKAEYENILRGFAILVLQCSDSLQCEYLLKRVIQPLILPLNQKILSLKTQKEREGRPLGKDDINEVTLRQI
jgi:hypothetical protein